MEVVDACAANYEQFNPRVNAIVTSLYERAREQASLSDHQRMRGEPLGPLHGLPLALKDMTETGGWRREIDVLQANAAFERLRPWNAHYPQDLYTP